MTVLLSVALILTPAPLTPPKEPVWLPTPSSSASVSNAADISMEVFWSFPPTETTLVEDLPAPSIAIPAPPSEPEPPLPSPPTARELVDSIFGWPGAQLVQCESRWDQYAVGRFGERGLFQVHPLWIPTINRLGWSWDDMFQPEPNVRMAAHIRRVQGLTAWTCWKG